MGVCVCLCVCVCVYNTVFSDINWLYFLEFSLYQTESFFRVLQIGSVSVYAGLWDEMRKGSDSHQNETQSLTDQVKFFFP